MNSSEARQPINIRRLSNIYETKYDPQNSLYLLEVSWQGQNQHQIIILPQLLLESPIMFENVAQATPNTTQEIDMEDYIQSNLLNQTANPSNLQKFNIIEELKAKVQNDSLMLSKKEQEVLEF